MTGIAAIILTYNEERHIERVIQNIHSLASEIYIIDSFSSDRTLEIAQRYPVTILQNRFVNYAKQFEWALENAPITASWILRIDADEIITPSLAANIKQTVASAPTDVVGINLKRTHVFMDRKIRYGGRDPLVLLRIWRRGFGRIENRWMDEHIVVWGG